MRTGWPATITITIGLSIGAAAAAPGRGEVVVPRVERPPRFEEFLGLELPPAWEGRLAEIEGLTQREPEDGEPASQRTRILLGYDDRALYVVFLAYDDEPDRVRAHLARRETVFDDEIVEIQLDTFGREQRAFTFICNPFGVQWDAIWREGQGFDSSWDAVWDSRGQPTERGYVVMMTVPFRSLRFPAGDEQTWRVLFVRDIPRNNESSFWPPVTSRVEGRLQQAGTLRGLRGISPGRNAHVIPYGTAESFRTLDRRTATFDDEPADAAAGADAKLVIRDRLALDLTANPDFSQVESDEPQVTINQRFEVFFPERRPFFLENADDFNTPFTLLFTRRVQDPRAGARLTGRIGAHRLGLLWIDDERPGDAIAELDPSAPDAGERARFAVARVSRTLGRQSEVGFMYTDREFGGGFNRVAGFDGRIKLDDNWVTQFQGVWSASRLVGDGAETRRVDDPALSVQFDRSGRHFGTHIHYRDVGRDFRAEAGFVPRVDIRDLHQDVSYTFRPEGTRLVSWGPGIFVQRITDHDGVRLDSLAQARLEWEFRRRTEFEIFARTGRERLRPDDLPSGSPSLTALDFRTHEVGISAETSFVTSVRASVSYSEARSINFVPPPGVDPSPADRSSARGELTLRLGRRHRLSGTWLYVRLDDRDDGSEIFSNSITRARWDWQLTRQLSLRTIMQYERTDAWSSRSRLEDSETLNGDLLATWLFNPWTAVYLGYTGSWADVAVVDGPGGPAIAPRENGLLHDGRQVFLKVSWLFGL